MSRVRRGVVIGFAQLADLGGFERDLMRLLRRRVPEMWIESRLERLDAGASESGADPLPGDIDIAIADSVRRCLTLVEAKANLPAFVAYDMASLHELRDGDLRARLAPQT